MKNKSNKDSVSIPKMAIAGMAPVIGIWAVLLSKDKTPEMFLFLIGVALGIFIGISLRKK